MVNEKNNYVTIIGLFHITDCNNTGVFLWVSCFFSYDEINTKLFSIGGRYRLSG